MNLVVENIDKRLYVNNNKKFQDSNNFSQKKKKLTLIGVKKGNCTHGSFLNSTKYPLCSKSN